MSDGCDASLVRTLLVAPDVWEKMRATIPSDDSDGGMAMHGITIVSDQYLAPGTMVPLDKNGMPILKRWP